MKAVYNYHEIEKVKRPALTGFRKAISLIPPKILHNKKQKIYDASKKGTAKSNFMSNMDKVDPNFGLVTANLLINDCLTEDIRGENGDIVVPGSVTMIKNTLVRNKDVVFVPIHALFVDPDDLDHPKVTDQSDNFLAYALAKRLAEETGKDFYPWLEPTNTVHRTSLAKEEALAFQPTFRAADGEKNALTGKSVILVDDYVHYGASIYSAAATVLEELGAKAVIGCISLTQTSVPQNEDQYNHAWGFLPDERTMKKFQHYSNYMKDTGLFEKTMGFTPDRLAQKEMDLLLEMIEKARKDKGSRYVSLDSIMEKPISIRTTWAETHHGTPDTSPTPSQKMRRKKNDLTCQ